MSPAPPKKPAARRLALAAILSLLLHLIILLLLPAEESGSLPVSSPELVGRMDLPPPPPAEPEEELFQEAPDPLEEPREPLPMTQLATEAPELIPEEGPDQAMPLAVASPDREKLKQRMAALSNRTRSGATTGRGTTEGVSVPPPAEPEPEPEPVEPAEEPMPASLVQGLEKTGGLVVEPFDLRMPPEAGARIRDRLAMYRIYPEDAVALGIEGRVEVRFRLGPDGAPREVTAMNRDTGDPSLVQAALDSVRAAGPYPLPRFRTRGALYLAAACYSDGLGGVTRLSLIERTGRAGLDANAAHLAEDRCADLEQGWHVVEFQESFQVELKPGKTGFEPVLVEQGVSQAWREDLSRELGRMLEVIPTTASIRVPILYQLTY